MSLPEHTRPAGLSTPSPACAPTACPPLAPAAPRRGGGQLALLAIAGVFLASALATAESHPGASSLAPLLENAMPAVVNIQTEGQRFSRVNPWLNDPFFERFFSFSFPSQKRTVRNVGSGVIIDAGEGHIVTNYHVLQGADRISVTLMDGRTLQASIIGQDEESDLALIKIEAEDLVDIGFVDHRTVRVGDYVVAIGNPFGFSHTVTQGIISGIGRTSVLQSKQSLIQTDASINPGNSGGALLNLDGKLVGINAAIYNPSGGGNIGIGFSIPSRTVERVSGLLLRYGEVRRFDLGIEGQLIDATLASALSMPEGIGGVIVMSMLSGSDADSFGLLPGDAIVELNGEAVNDANDLASSYKYLDPDERANLRVLRGQAEMLLGGRVGEGKPVLLPGERVSHYLKGVSFAEHQVFEGSSPGRQVVVHEIDDNSSTKRFGVRAKDILSRVNETRIDSLEDFRAFAGIKRLLLEFSRGDSTYRLVIR